MQPASLKTQTFYAILNPAAGTGSDQDLNPKLQELFQKQGTTLHIVQPQEGQDFTQLAQSALQKNPTALIAGGGDGTVNAVASALVNGEVPLGILPLGTLNHFAKDLKIPLDLEKAVETILQGQVQKVDVGQLNERFFLNNSSLGVYPQIVRFREKLQSRTGLSKWPAFAWALWRVMRRYPLIKLRLKTEQEELWRHSPFIFVGNNEYQLQGLALGSRERLDRGQLCVYIKNSTKRLDALRVAYNIVLGRLKAMPEFEILHCQELHIESSRHRLPVAADGEALHLKAPLHYHSLAQALPVLVPRSDVKEAQN